MTDPAPQKLLTAPLPTNEAERLAALHRYKILDTPPEAAFDRITKLAARLFDMPIALISLVDESRAWFKSCVGFGANEVPRDNTLCSFAVLTDEPLIVPDTRLDNRFACNLYIRGANNQPIGLATVSRNITDRKQAETERQQLLEREQAARAEAERANRIKDEFLAVLSHELRSPLNPILGWTRLLENGKLDATRQREALNTIERNAKLQTQLIDDLLDISRIMQGKLSLTVTPVSLTFVITAAVETVRLAAEAKNIQILLDLTTAIASVSGDVARLQQVVWNLLTNAVKFTPNGGQVTIELRQLDHLAQIRVMDTGKGIAPQFLPHVFEYFRQADATTTRKFGGLGLGLAIVQQIVEMHGGSVWAESEGENRGATFTVQIPLSSQARSSEPEPPRDSTMAEDPLSNLQILLVDDETDTREFQTFILEQSGVRVTAVASGFEALQALDQFIPDMLVSDVGMAEMDGYMLMQQIRSRPHGKGGMIPAVALTAYARDFDQQKALQAGFQTHLSKPVEPEALVQAIICLCERTRGNVGEDGE